MTRLEQKLEVVFNLLFPRELELVRATVEAVVEESIAGLRVFDPAAYSHLLDQQGQALRLALFPETERPGVPLRSSVGAPFAGIPGIEISPGLSPLTVGPAKSTVGRLRPPRCGLRSTRGRPTRIERLSDRHPH